MKQQIANYLYKYRIIIIWLAILLLFGIALVKLQAIVSPAADKAYVDAKTKDIQNDRIQIKDSLKQQINQLQETPVNTQPGQLGTADPFNP